MLLIRKNGSTSNIIRRTLRNSTTGQGLTGLSNASSGLVISTICDNEASATAYTVAGATIQTIATLGTYAAPSASNCRFKEVDSTNHPGLYEFQFADARFAVSGSKVLRITVSGATNLLQQEILVQLTTFDVDSANPNVNASQIGGQNAQLDANNLLKVDTEDWKGSAAPAMTGDAYAYLGANLGALGVNATAISTAVWAVGTRTLTSFGTLTTDTATAVWNALTSGMSTAGSIGLKLANWVLGADNKALLSSSETGAGLTSVAPASTALSTAQWTNTRAAKLDNLDATMSSRMATFVYTTPPTTAQIATAIFTDLTAGTDFQTANSFGALIVSNVDAKVSTRSTLTAGAQMDLVNAPNATAVAAIQSGLATHTDAATIESAITALGSPMQAGSSVTVGTNNDKTGYGLASNGLDSVSTTAPSGMASNFREMLVALWRRSFKKSTLTATQLKTYADDGTTVLTTQTVSDDGTTQTQGAGS